MTSSVTGSRRRPWCTRTRLQVSCCSNSARRAPWMPCSTCRYVFHCIVLMCTYRRSSKHARGKNDSVAATVAPMSISGVLLVLVGRTRGDCFAQMTFVACLGQSRRAVNLYLEEMRCASSMPHMFVFMVGRAAVVIVALDLSPYSSLPELSVTHAVPHFTQNFPLDS